VRWAARELRSVLAELDLASFVMTTGSRGLHVHVPLERRAEFDGVKGFARGVARLLADRHDDRLTVEVRKDKRKGRVFVDYLRNEYAQTAVAPYALRAKPGAPVATPLSWDELSRPGMGPRRYNLGNLFRRLGAAADPWESIGETRGRVDGERRERLDAWLA